MSRIYLPATIALLARWYAAGEILGVDDGFVAPDDSEESEYAALMSAADVSSELLGGAGRRVVVVVETDVEDRVPLRDVVAVHADSGERPAGADPDEDLGWFARQEIPDLIGR